MSRSLPAALSTELNATELKPFYAIELNFDSGGLYFWTGYGEISASNQTWIGSGTVLSISTSSETTDLAANGINITMTGLDTSLVALALLENYRGRSAKLYIGALDSNNQPVSDLYQVFAGRMDIMTIQEDGSTATISITIENVLIDLERPRSRKYTNEEQLARYSGDNSLENVAKLADKQISWGK
jgi:hypothetical protein